MGKFSLKDNAASNYKARELKTVYIDCTCQYLKLLLERAHTNKFNLFNQVGFIQINCFGTIEASENDYLRGLNSINPIEAASFALTKKNSRLITPPSQINAAHFASAPSAMQRRPISMSVLDDKI